MLQEKNNEEEKSPTYLLYLSLFCAWIWSGICFHLSVFTSIS